MKNALDDSCTVTGNALLCPNCLAGQTVETIMLHSSLSWPYQSWILFTCPQCLKHSHVEVADRLIKTGVLDGAPAPCFICCSQLHVPGFVVRKEEDKVTCMYKKQSYHFPEKK